MRVALVTHRYLPHVGGIERYVGELASGLATRGFDVDVLTAEADSSLPRASREDGVAISRFGIPVGMPRYAVSPGLARRVLAGMDDYDVVHVNNYHELVTMLAAFGRPRRLVVTPHYHPPAGGIPATALRRLHGAVAVPALRRADAVVCVSHAEATALQAEVRGISDRIKVVPLGVDVAEIRAAQPWPASRPVVLTLGRLVAYKRVDAVIEAMARVRAEAELVVVGDGPQADALRAVAAARGVVARFTGAVTEAERRRWLRTATVLVTMSEREAFGLTVLEARAAGALVVASDLPAHREAGAMGGVDGTRIVDRTLGAGPLAGEIEQSLAHGRQGPPGALPSWADVVDGVAEVYDGLVRDQPARTA